jgi:hypothetical protein
VSKADRQTQLVNGCAGRYRTNVWNYRSVNIMRAGRMDELSLHPAVKPVQMIVDSIKDVSGRGGVCWIWLLDPTRH